MSFDVTSSISISISDAAAKATPLALEQKQKPLSNIMQTDSDSDTDTEIDMFTSSCNDDTEFNDFVNNTVQVQESDCGKRLPTLHLHDHSEVHDALVLAPLSPTHYNGLTTHENEHAR